MNILQMTLHKNENRILRYLGSHASSILLPWVTSSGPHLPHTPEPLWSHIMKAVTTLVSAALLTSALSAEARLSSPAEARGYGACFDAAAEALPGLVAKRDYFISKSDEGNTYFINGTAWQGNTRADVRVYCETASNGRKLSTLRTSEGRFALADGMNTDAIAAK